MPDEEEPIDLQTLLTTPPDGMTVNRHDDERFVIYYRRIGMGCMNAFLSFWLAA